MMSRKLIATQACRGFVSARETFSTSHIMMAKNYLHGLRGVVSDHRGRSGVDEVVAGLPGAAAGRDDD
jgi:hypothetical protein